MPLYSNTNCNNNTIIKLLNLVARHEHQILQKIESLLVSSAIHHDHSFETILHILWNIRGGLHAKNHSQKVEIITHLAKLNDIDLDQYCSQTKISNVLSSLSDGKTDTYTPMINILREAAQAHLEEKITMLSHNLNQFTQDNHYLYKLSNKEIDDILYLYRKKSECITKQIKTQNIVEFKVQLSTLYNTIIDNFPMLSKICKTSLIEKDNVNIEETTIADLPKEIQNQVFLHLQLSDIVSDSVVNSPETVEIIGSIIEK